MRTSFVILSLIAVAAPLAAQQTMPRSTTPLVSGGGITYPRTRMGDVVDVHHGVRVADPYRWLEEGSAETASWVAAQNAVTHRYLNALPMKERLRSRLTEVFNYARVSTPDVQRGRMFYRRNTGLQKQSVLYVRPRAGGAARVLIDPNRLTKDGSLALQQVSASPDARHVAYGLSEGGADWQTIHVRDVATGRDLPDTIRWFRFSGMSWTKDGKGFFYARYPEPPVGQALQAALRNHTLYYHRIGTPQSADQLVFERKDLPTWFVGGGVSEDGRTLLISTSKGSDNNNRLYYADLGDPMRPNIGAPVRPLIERDDAQYAPIEAIGSTVYLQTDRGAPNRTVVAFDLATPDSWRTVVPEGPQSIEDAFIAGGRVVVHTLADVTSRLRVFSTSGTLEREIELPGVGTARGFGGHTDQDEIYFAFTSPLSPSTVYRYDLATGRATPFEPPKMKFDFSRYETVRHFATSKDGTKVPYFVTARKGLPRNGDNPTYLYGYGGFSVSITPGFSAATLPWLEQGGVHVTANMRGGGEYGEAWHDAGKLGKKQNVFDDFIAVAEDLVRTKVTRPERLAIAGGSNGGLLVGAVMQQRPDLFAVAFPAVGVMDMLRYDKFTGGQAWATEYGSASDSAAFRWLHAYSPLHNVKPGTCYPATLVSTADHDDRVVPSHSYKFTAAMQAAQGCARPMLIRVQTKGSHGYLPIDKVINDIAEEWAFALENMKVEARPNP
jgi:prolyl oligopeptidase